MLTCVRVAKDYKRFDFGSQDSGCFGVYVGLVTMSAMLLLALCTACYVSMQLLDHTWAAYPTV